MKLRFPVNSFVILTSLTLVGCSTQKNTLLTRSYHNLTSHYNVYFNGYESYKQGLRKLQQSGKDDYTRVLDVFPDTDPSQASSLGPDMERAIKKATKVVSNHSITVKPKRKDRMLTEKEKAFYSKNEYNKWIDDAYLLMGKSHFFKQDYTLSINMFRHIIQVYDDQASRLEANLWLARINNQQGNFRDAARVLEQLNSERTFPRKLRSLFHATYAQHFILQKQFEKAIPWLQNALKYSGSRNLRTRYSFILAQLFQETGNSAQATYYYAQVIKKNPPYEMTFNAKINRAGTFDVDQDTREIKKQLTKMLRDDKNAEYQDQIYYALGNIAFREGQVQDAIDMYLQSARTSVSNSTQKGLSFLTVADYYFSHNRYREARTFYDSAVIFLTSEFPEYDAISAKSRNLNHLVSYIETIEREDSLQAVAALSPDERNILIDKIIQDIRRTEQLQQQEKMQAQVNTMMYYQNEARFRDDISREGQWYFYNQTALTFGQTEFRRKWGDRKLEDNWRRRNKSIVTFETGSSGIQTDTGAPASGDTGNTTDNKSREYYLKDIPVNDSLMALSHQRIKTAMFNLARAYRDDFGDNDKAVESFEKLYNRYPGDAAEPDVLYSLYTINNDLKNTVKAEYYRSMIISRYPDSEYAKMISDPQYFTKILEKQREVEMLYQEMFGIYQSGGYSSVPALADAALTKYPDHPLVPKFMYLKAMSLGRSIDPLALVDMLEEIQVKFPDDPVARSAREVCEAIRTYRPEVREAQESLQAEELYKPDEKDALFFAVVINRRISSTQLVFNIVNFNIEYYTNVNLEVEEEEFDSQNKIITVRRFADPKSAVDYHQRILADPEVFKAINLTPDQAFIISATHYPILVQDKSLSTYLKFYKKQYLR